MSSAFKEFFVDNLERSMECSEVVVTAPSVSLASRDVGFVPVNSLQQLPVFFLLHTISATTLALLQNA